MLRFTEPGTAWQLPRPRHYRSLGAHRAEPQLVLGKCKESRTLEPTATARVMGHRQVTLSRTSQYAKTASPFPVSVCLPLPPLLEDGKEKRNCTETQLHKAGFRGLDLYDSTVHGPSSIHYIHLWSAYYVSAGLCAGH